MQPGALCRDASAFFSFSSFLSISRTECWAVASLEYKHGKGDVYVMTDSAGHALTCGRGGQSLLGKLPARRGYQLVTAMPAIAIYCQPGLHPQDVSAGR